MKKTLVIIFPLVLFIGLLVGCINPKESSNSPVNRQNEITDRQRDIREAVWDQLKSQDKQLIKGTWHDSCECQLSFDSFR